MEDLFSSDSKLRQLKENGKLLGPTWRPLLNELRGEGKIDKDEYNLYKQMHENASKRNVVIAQKKYNEEALLSRAIECHDCRTLINGGTYGNIYSTDVENIVIKGSRKAHSEAFGCPSDFTHEYHIFHEIKDIFPPTLHVIDLVTIIPPVWVEKRRCYFKMEKLFPVVFDEHQNLLLEKQIAETDNSDLRYMLEQIKNHTQLYMLVPGILEPRILFNQGGGITSNWREVNEPIMLILFQILNIDIHQYYNDLIELLKTCFDNNIYLIDVEFILASRIKTNPDGSIQRHANGEPIKENKIFMIDFDKVTKDSSIPKTLDQDMFSVKVKEFFRGKRGGKMKKNKKTRKNNSKNKKCKKNTKRNRKYKNKK